MTAVASIGVIADTHCEAMELAELPAGVLEALRGCELILHCGDIIARETLDQLAEVAPVVAVRSPADPEADGVLLFEPPRLVDFAGLRVGMLSRPADLSGQQDLASGPGTDTHTLAQRATEIFGSSVDVVVYRGSHEPHVDEESGLLLVDPGSPTFWAGRKATVGRLNRDGDGSVRYEIVDVTSRLPVRVRLRWVWLRRWRGITMAAYGARSSVRKRVARQA